MISTAIQQLVNYGLDTGLILPDDEIYIRNQLLMTMQLDDFTAPDSEVCYTDLESILKTLVDDAVARGVCEVRDGMLVDIVERTKIYQRGEHAVYTEDNETFIDLPGDTIVSMNIWGFTQPMVSELWSRLSTFLAQQVPQNPMKCEFYLPNAVNQQLEQVYKGLGEMQSLAADVGGLKQVLSGVKTRGILGEIQLGAILEEILAPEQYDTNVATIPGSTQRVEYAIRMPGADGGTVWLPIDSKFPGDTYAHLQDAQASGDAQAVENARHALELVLRSEAKDIREKYVEPPYTTAFGILFLPFEGLYAEVVNAGLLEVLQRDYQVNIAGPSTMAALLNSLQMGFKTLAIQKRSGEVWQLLGAVKTEFDKFGQGLSKMQQRLRQTDEELDNLIGVRSRAISRKLRAVQTMDEGAAAALLELDNEPGRPVAARLPENGEEL